ncbi:MAG: hypothetical protein ACTS9Y_02095 [Methylophilus sp.]
MDENRLIQQVLQTWQSIGADSLWHQDAFLVFMSVIAVVMLFFTGTVLGLFIQSLWGIFITNHHLTEADN